MKYIKIKRFISPILLSLFCLIMIVFLINEYNKFDRGLKEKKVRTELRESLLSQKSRLEKALYSRIYFTRSVAAYVAINSDISKESFNILAKEFISGDTVISTMSLAPNCVIQVIFPLEGHEDAIGLELLKHPKRKEMVEKSILTHQTFIAGPVELVEGGIAFISYTPVFSTFGGTKANFWGVTDIVIYRDKLFSEVGLIASDSKFKYAMKGIDGSGNKGECFWGEPKAFENNPVTIDVQLPTGTWTLAATPHNGWSELIRQNESLYFLLYVSAFIISLLVWLWAQALSKIRANEKELKALFGSMEDLIIEFNKEGEYVKIAPTNEKLLVLPKAEILGKKLHEIFDKETADYFYNAIRKCLETKELVVIDYNLPINNIELWFRARISYLSDNSVIFLAHDNTTLKKQEVAILESKQKLKNLNIQKDKLFSIIAHDLKSPLGSFREITKLLYDEYDIFGESERKDFLQMIKDSSSQVYELLENLLEWSRSQKGQLVFIPEELDLKSFIDNSINLMHFQADKKSIDLINLITDETKIYADINMLNSILRNLISNAIKFTNKNGKIEIGIILQQNRDSQTQNNFIEIFVRDKGIGMLPETTEMLFRIDQNITNIGTEGESGTGLGLILCKEFTEKHNGSISVESEIGIGSTFYLKLPVE